jgi:hypothetical protein
VKVCTVPITRKNAGMPALAAIDRSKTTPYGGLLLVEALCRRWNLWNHIDQKELPAPQDTDLGPRPAESIIAQLLFSFARGGTSLAEAAMLRDDPLLLRLVGLKRAAEESTLNAWLAAQTETSVQELRKLNAALVKSALQECCPAKTEDKANPLDIVMRTKWWTISRGTHAVVENGLPGVQLCWRSLGVGPFLLDGVWSENPGVAEHTAHFEELVSKHCRIWEGYETYFSSGDLPDGVVWQKAVGMARFAQWTAEVDRGTVYSGCNFDPDSRQLRWKDAVSNDALAQHYCLIYPGTDRQTVVPGVVAVARRKDADDQFYRHRFLVVPTNPGISAQTWFVRHFLVKAPALQMLDDLNLNRLLSFECNAQAACFVIASLAYNLLTALRLLLVPESHWTTREVIRSIITAPLTVSTSGRRDTGYLAVTPAWPAGWRELVESSMPGAGRPSPKR